MEPSFTAWTKIALRLITIIAVSLIEISIAKAQPVQGGTCSQCTDLITNGGYEGTCYCCDPETCDCEASGGDCTGAYTGWSFYCDREPESGETAVESQCAIDEGIPLNNQSLLIGLMLSGIFIVALNIRSL